MDIIQIITFAILIGSTVGFAIWVIWLALKK